MSAHKTECIPTLTQSPHIRQATYITGKVGTHMTAILLDSGASCSVLSSVHIFLPHLQQEHKIRLINVDGQALSSMGITETDVVLGDFQTTHTFVTVDSLSTPVILGYDFLTKHGLIIDFDNLTVRTSDHQRFQLSLH